MLTKVSYDEVPGYLRRSNPNRKFAEQTVGEFIDLGCDAAEVTGWPLENQSVSGKAGHLKTAIKEKSATRVVRVSCSGDRVYLVRAR